MNPTPPDALLLISSHCPHCPAQLALLAELVKAGAVGRLEVVNVEAHPEVAQALAVRSVPWLRLGGFELPGQRGRAELEAWAGKAGTEAGWADYFHELLKEGQAKRAIELVQADPVRLASVLPIVGNPEASLNVRLGAGVILEEFAHAPAYAAVVDGLGRLSADPDPRVRADACHYLGLAGVGAVRPYLEARLNDPDAEVREIARESLEALG